MAYAAVIWWKASLNLWDTGILVAIYVAYLLVLSLPTSTWALAAADSYAHYGTLPVGLVLLAALVELGERSLPMAMAARPEEAGPTPGAG